MSFCFSFNLTLHISIQNNILPNVTPLIPCSANGMCVNLFLHILQPFHLNHLLQLIFQLHAYTLHSLLDLSLQIFYLFTPALFWCCFASDAFNLSTTFSSILRTISSPFVAIVSPYPVQNQHMFLQSINPSYTSPDIPKQSIHLHFSTLHSAQHGIGNRSIVYTENLSKLE